jgi:hypothetical protein
VSRADLLARVASHTQVIEELRAQVMAQTERIAALERRLRRTGRPRPAAVQRWAGLACAGDPAEGHWSPAGQALRRTG